MTTSICRPVVALVERLWNSPVMLSWAGMMVRSLALVVVIPLVILRLDPAETAVWFLAMLVFGMVPVLAFGGTATFSRLLGYGMGGASLDQISHFDALKLSETGAPNVDTLTRLVATMRQIFLILSLVSFLLLASAGTLAMLKPISQLENPGPGWWSWWVIVASTAMRVYGQSFVAYLQGTNNLVILRRWELWVAIGHALTLLAVILSVPDLLILVIAAQSWAVLAIIGNYWLCRKVGALGFAQSRNMTPNRATRSLVLSKIWRSGVGLSISFGLPRLTGLVHAQFAVGLDLTAYLLGLRLIGLVSQLSIAPFYAKLPIMAQMVAGHRFTSLLNHAARGAAVSYWSFVLAFLAVAFAGEKLLPLVNISDDVFDAQLWGWLGLAFFLERYCSHFLQIYSLTNVIHWHIVNGVWGLIYLLTVVLSIGELGVLAYPLGMIVAYAFFHGPVNVFLAYRAFNIPVPSFEIRTSLLPALILAAYMIYLAW